MGRGFYRDLVDILRQNGCKFVRQGRGDHEIWFSPVSNCNFTVDKGCLSAHTANASLKQAGLPKKF
ncbi:type II toxin-antitoxin system HicA family toxin [Haematobacter sp.]|uniref:type II toxin-antitoxin system HicA family toxin n=1 Tax=Haematobacter sp. TaxID=2953762 RepID=UPI0028ACAA9F|nr:type II toxin-antitoxin system HicA family toxin [Haematobacter sp.]